jgi:plasmid maintenance system antidote protein VapI
MMAAGVSLPTAIKEALAPLTIAAFAEKYGRAAPTISNVINGNVKPSDADIDALVAEFGGDSHEWRLLLWEHSKPTAAAS